jgi:anti-anti-sigma factor
MWQARPKGERPGRIEIDPAALTPLPKRAVDEEGEVTVAAMENVALAFVSVPEVRERQAESIQGKLLSVAERAQGRLAVSMSEVRVLTSSGINALLAVHLKCEELGGHLAVFALSKDLMRMVKTTKLDRKLVLAETAHEAVRSFHGGTRKRGLLGAALSWARQEKDAA